MITQHQKAHTMWMCALSEELTRTEPGRLGRTVQRPAAGANQGFLYVRPNCNGILVSRFLELTTAFCHVTTSPLYGQEKQLAQDEKLTLYS